MGYIEDVLRDEGLRRSEFPVVSTGIFFGHAGVSPFPHVVSEAVREYAVHAQFENQENPQSFAVLRETRTLAARLIGAHADEVSLLGPTSLGISLVAAGISWESGDEVVFYQDDYPANVYPWMQLADRGVSPVRLETEYPGVITWEHVERVLSDRTKLVSLASCHFLSGFRIDVADIGRRLRERGVLFSVDGIQTVGAFPTNVDHVDFLCADSHKWMLGPATAGIFYVSRRAQDMLKPVLVGSGNIHSPDFVAQDNLQYHTGAQRYEPGMLNYLGIHGLHAALTLSLNAGIEQIARRLLILRSAIVDRARDAGYSLYIQEYDERPGVTDDTRSAIVTLRDPKRNMDEVFERLRSGNVTASLRRNRAGDTFIRFSPHFYNTMEEVDRAVELLR